MKITLVVLTRNELDCVEIVGPTIPKPGPESGIDQVVVIDGNSTDGTVEWFKSRGFTLVPQEPGSRGAAFLSAFNAVETDAYVFYSPDGNEDLKDLPKFRKHLEAGADIVIASRMMKGAWNEEDSQFIKPRKWANNAFNLAANLFFRKSSQPFVYDTINGYRAITRKAAKALQLDARDYTIEYQMSIRGLRDGLKIVEFPTHEGPRVAGETGAKSIPTGLRFIKRFLIELMTKK